MIDNLTIENFKCFQHRKSFEFGKLNLLTGINGRGKSSLLQSLLLLSQSAWLNQNLTRLVINDELVSLGNYDDIKNSETPRGEGIRFLLRLFKESEFEVLFSEIPEEPLIADRKALYVIKNEEKIFFNNKSHYGYFSDLIDLLKKIHFVSADRLGPIKYVDKSSLSEFLHVGPRGEHTINILANSMNLPNVNDLLYRGKDSKSLIQQTSEWLSYILDGASIEIQGRSKESSVLYMLMNNRNSSYSYKPTNVGFGYSYVLPLVVTGLIANPGEIVIIENPEAHLHPRAQSRIAEFFTNVASTGVQVFIESHSEHILNGLRINCLAKDSVIEHTDLAIHYFNEAFDSVRLNMDDKGKIGNWPNGFFDQQEMDLADLFKLSQ